MAEYFVSQYATSEPYVPATLSEIYDALVSFLGGAPGFIDTSGHFPEQNIHTEFAMLNAGFAKVRDKVGEQRYARLIALAAEAKRLFEADPDDTNGKTDEGVKLIHEIEEIIQSVRRKRVEAKEKDEDGEVSGD